MTMTVEEMDKFNKDAEDAIFFLRRYQTFMTDEGRKKIWDKLTDGYCEHCGSKHLPCYCTNDE